MITDLINLITLEGIPVEKELSTIVNIFKGNEDASEKGNKGLKLTVQILEIIKRVITKLI